MMFLSVLFARLSMHNDYNSFNFAKSINQDKESSDHQLCSKAGQAALTLFNARVKSFK
jgi:hypothetical protein